MIDALSEDSCSLDDTDDTEFSQSQNLESQNALFGDFLHKRNTTLSTDLSVADEVRRFLTMTITVTKTPMQFWVSKKL